MNSSTNSACPSHNWVAVLGGALRYSDEQIVAAFQLGVAIANRGHNLVTGATTGIPYAAALGAKREGAMVVGISPATNAAEHIERFRKPIDALDMIVYSGMNVDGRSPLIVRSCGAAVFVGGEFGTLNEFTSAWLSGTRVLGILEGHGGISDTIRALMEKTESSWGSQVIFESEPVRLAHRLCEEIDQRLISDRSDADGNEELGLDVRRIVGRHLNEQQL